MPFLGGQFCDPWPNGRSVEPLLRLSRLSFGEWYTLCFDFLSDVFGLYNKRFHMHPFRANVSMIVALHLFQAHVIRITLS